MGGKRWQVDIDGRRHEVTVDHGYFSARRRIEVDGVPVIDVRPGPFNAVRLWNTATEHVFTIDGHAAAVRIDPGIDNMTYKKFLFVDGRDVDSGAMHKPLPMNEGGAREGRWLDGYGGVLVQPFALAALVMGQIAYRSQGAVLPLAMGFAGAGLCWMIGRWFRGQPVAQVVGCCLVVLAISLPLWFD